MALTTNEMISRNTAAIKALELAVERLRELRKGKELTIRKRYTREIARANEEITDLEIVNGHLRAAGTVIDPIDGNVQARLDILADRIDAEIRKDFKINAAFDTVLDVISFAEEIGAIIDSHEHA
jgi:hypothetical protein